MEMIWYDIEKGGLCFNWERRTPLQSYIPKGKNLDYYIKTKHGLGYISSEPMINVVHEKSLESTSFRSSSPSSTDSEFGLNDLF